jgi:NADH-quinone oxidoreductase subunit M
MDFLHNHLLTILTFFPLLAAIIVVLMGRSDRGNDEQLKTVALVLSIVEFVLSLPLAYLFSPEVKGYQFEFTRPWISAAKLNIQYHLGVDGLSLWLVVLTTFITPIAILGSYQYIKKYVREFLALMLILETGMVGVFCALDMFLFYLFWEVMLVPMYFIIGVWGGERRIYAAIKFVLYTMVGSLLMLVAIIAVYLMHAKGTGVYTFDLPTITKSIQDGVVLWTSGAELWLFGAFALAFLIKVPLFPFHTWLPDAHVEAPTPGSVILASVLLKMGIYGLLRFNLPLFMGASVRMSTFICILAVIGIIYGALVAMVQPDVKKLIAYSSVSHLGFCVLGIFSFTEMGLQGALVQALAHGFSTGALFLIVGMMYERRHTRLISKFGGLANGMPLFSALFLVTTLASIGLPLLCGFVGEFLVLNGTFNSTVLSYAHTFTGLAATAMVWGAVYMLWMYQRVVMGEVTDPENKTIPDLSPRETFVLVPLIVMMVVLGIFPAIFMNKSQPTLDAILEPLSTSANTASVAVSEE